jgi:CheY-like chemotaxis protein
MEERQFQILLVEDNPGDVYLFKRALVKAGLESEIIPFADGAAAMAFVRRESPHEQSALPDLAVLDMNLPKRDGTEILKAMRESAEFARVPVVMMSSSASPREQAKTKELGDTRYLTKPMDLDGYLAIGEVLKEILLAGRARGQSANG